MLFRRESTPPKNSTEQQLLSIGQIRVVKKGSEQQGYKGQQRSAMFFAISDNTLSVIKLSAQREQGTILKIQLAKFNLDYSREGLRMLLHPATISSHTVAFNIENVLFASTT